MHYINTGHSLLNFCDYCTTRVVFNLMCWRMGDILAVMVMPFKMEKHSLVLAGGAVVFSTANLGN